MKAENNILITGIIVLIMIAYSAFLIIDKFERVEQTLTAQMHEIKRSLEELGDKGARKHGY